MSEYQYIGFRAIDRPLTNAELKYAKSQSSRAEITRWTFDNEYHYGDFRGDALAMLRRGFDVHFHYANYGIRQLSMRLPDGFPCRESVWVPYVDGGRVMWDPDKRGRGGILTVSPDLEPEAIDELWDPDEFLNDVAGIRNELIGGDLRVLYAMWLCGCQDNDLDPADVTEPPVPAGIAKATEAIETLLQIYDRDPLVLTAAGEAVPAEPSQQHAIESLLAAWAEKLPAKQARSIVHRLLSEDVVALRAELMRSFRNQNTAPAWPTVPGSRTLAALLERTEILRAEADAVEAKRQAAKEKRAAAKREQDRQERMKQMVLSPAKWLQEADRLAAKRGRENYAAAAAILADLREAVGGQRGDQLATQHAAKLRKTYPTLNLLTSELRKKQLLK